MIQSKTEADKLYDEVFGLVTQAVAISEIPKSYGIPNSIKVEAIRELTHKTFRSILRKIENQRDRACAVSNN